MLATTFGKLYLIPTTLGDNVPDEVLPYTVKRVIENTQDFIVENEKAARRFIKSYIPEKKQSELRLHLLNKHTKVEEHNEMLAACFDGKPVGLLSDAGCPGIADPGAAIVAIAHRKNIQVVPLVGPSSILLALMASGMNGQSFTFNGYIPIDKSERKNTIKALERISMEKNQSQLFIETPYRNNKLVEDLCTQLHPSTMLCIACDITLPTEYIKTLTIQKWKKEKVDLHNRPAIFIIHRLS